MLLSIQEILSKKNGVSAVLDSEAFLYRAKHETELLVLSTSQNDEREPWRLTHDYFKLFELRSLYSNSLNYGIETS